MGLEVHPWVLDSTQKLVRVRKEWHSQKRHGEDAVWVVMDRERRYAIMAQRLQAISDFINTHLSDGSKASVVSMKGMYDMVDGQQRANGGWHKGRWSVSAVALEDASRTFESLRNHFETLILVGAPGVFQVARV